METEDRPVLDLGAIDFTPDWAKRDAGVSVGHVKSERETPERKSFGDRKGFGERRPFGDAKKKGPQGPRSFDRRPREAERPKPLDVDVKILPETKALGTIIRKLQQDFHAYKLKDLAYFFLDNPSSVLLKITPREEAKTGAEKMFRQCKACGFASTNEDDVVQHILTATTTRSRRSTASRLRATSTVWRSAGFQACCWGRRTYTSSTVSSVR